MGVAGYAGVAEAGHGLWVRVLASSLNSDHGIANQTNQEKRTTLMISAGDHVIYSTAGTVL